MNIEAIKQYYREAEELKTAIAELERIIENHALLMQPDEGWEGKNEEQRRAARARALSANDNYRSMAAILNEKRRLFGITLGEIAAFEAERRDNEWRIRERYVNSLMSRTGALVLPGEDALWGQR